MTCAAMMHSSVVRGLMAEDLPRVDGVLSFALLLVLILAGKFHRVAHVPDDEHGGDNAEQDQQAKGDE
jgi:hypothetical protein